MLTLNNLRSPGATRNTKRIGRGQGSGWGTQAGKGDKGQKARAGGGQIAAKFDGEEVNRETLVAKGLLSGKNKRLPIKILLKGDLTKAHTFMNIEKFSKTAADAVAKAGGKIESKEVSKEA